MGRCGGNRNDTVCDHLPLLHVFHQTTGSDSRTRDETLSVETHSRHNGQLQGRTPGIVP